MLPDIQQELDCRKLSLDRVGISELDFPLMVEKKGGGSYTIPARFEVYGSLFHTLRGTHMSRFSEVLMECIETPLSPDNFKEVLLTLKQRIDAEDVYISAEFLYFILKEAPVSKKPSLMSYKCRFIGRIFKKEYSFVLQVEVPITSVCPCSKHISKYGAHNQRGIVTLQVKGTTLPYIEDLIKVVEKNGSSELYSLLKRKDEKFVTERGYENPKFCEDIVRDIALDLQKDEGINWFKVRVKNYESIHNHNAVAYLARIKYRKGKWKKSSRSFY